MPLFLHLLWTSQPRIVHVPERGRQSGTQQDTARRKGASGMSGKTIPSGCLNLVAWLLVIAAVFSPSAGEDSCEAQY